MFVHRRRSAAAVDRASSFQPFSFFLSSLGATFFFMFFLLPSRIVWGESAKLTHSLTRSPTSKTEVCRIFSPERRTKEPNLRTDGRTGNKTLPNCERKSNRRRRDRPDEWRRRRSQKRAKWLWACSSTPLCTALHVRTFIYIHMVVVRSSAIKWQVCK